MDFNDSIHGVKLLGSEGGEMKYFEEENSLRQFCIDVVDAKSYVLEYSTRAMCIVG